MLLLKPFKLRLCEDDTEWRMLGGTVGAFYRLLGDESSAGHRQRLQRERKDRETSMWHQTASSVMVPNEKNVDLISA